MGFDRIAVRDPNALFNRYETLKRQYFSPRSRRIVDDEGQEVPNCISKEMLIKQFEEMGCEVPMTPDQPFTPAQVQRHE